MATDRDIVKDANHAYEMAWSSWQDWLLLAELDLRMYLGDQWDQQWKTYLTNRNRTAKVFNRLARIIDIISGYEQQTRKSLKATPIGLDDDQVSTQMSDVLMTDLKLSNGYDQISDAFKLGPLVTGRNFLELFMGKDGRLKVRRVMYNHILPDPVSTEKDLSDADYIYHREMVTIKQAKRLLRGKRDSELELLAGKMDDKFPGIPWALRNYSEKMIAYDRFWEKGGKYRTFVIDKQTGEEQEWTGATNRLRFLLGQAPDRFGVIERWVDQINLNIIVGGELMSNTTDPLAINEYPYVLMTGNWVPDIDDDGLKLQGLVRRLGDPQKEYNKRICQEIDFIESHVQTGWVIEEGALVDDRQAYEGGQGGALWMKKDKQGRPMSERMKEIVPKDIPPGHFQINNTLEKQLPELAVINEEFMGTSEKDIPGVLGRLRQGQAITGIQGYFGGKRLAFRLLGRKWMKAAQIRYAPEQVSRIAGEPVVPEFYKTDLIGYDVVTEEGLLTDTQREIAYAEARELYNTTGGPGRSPIPASVLIKLAPLSMKKVTMDAIAQNEKAQAQQRQIDQKNQELLQGMQMAEIQTKMAQAAERQAAANENQAEAGLDRARTITEIQSMEFDNVIRSLQVLKTLQQPATPAKQLPAQEVA